VSDVALWCKILYHWTVIGWIGGEDVKRNGDYRIKIGSVIIKLFVFYKHDDDTSKQCLICVTTTKLDLQSLHVTWGTLGGENGRKCKGYLSFDYKCLSDF
jgi:hypothetical protein